MAKDRPSVKITTTKTTKVVGMVEFSRATVQALCEEAALRHGIEIPKGAEFRVHSCYDCSSYEHGPDDQVAEFTWQSEEKETT